MTSNKYKVSSFACKLSAASLLILLSGVFAIEVSATSSSSSSAASPPLMSVRSLFDVCDDKKPSGRHSCEEQKAWGKCKEEWFVRGNYCRKTCGKCVPFDPKTVDLKLAAAMRQCGLESKKTKDTCIAALKGESSELRIHSKLTSEESLSIEEVLESSSFFETMKACKVDCLVKSSSDNFVHALVENFLEKHPSKRQVSFSSSLLSLFLIFFSSSAHLRTR